MASREINFSMTFTTSESGTANCENYLGATVGSFVVTLLNTLGSIVASLLATQTIVDFVLPKEIEIKRVTISLEPGKTATGKLFILGSPAAVSPNEILSNYSLAYLNNSKEISFEPKVPYHMTTASADLKTIRFMIKGHTVGAKVTYQVSFDAEEYDAV